MQSKLPVRIKRKLSNSDKKCCCKFWKVVIDPPNEAGDKSNITKKVSLIGLNKELLSKITQTDLPDEISYSEIKIILLSINRTLENILHTLQKKKEDLYGKLEDDLSMVKKSKLKKEMKKNKMALQIARKMTYTWPEISRLNFGQALIPKHYMQRQIASLQLPNTLIICPKKSAADLRPFFGSNINYFQPGAKIIQRRALGCIYPAPVLTMTTCRPGKIENKDENVSRSKEKVGVEL